jgi:hypothetical protein
MCRALADGLAFTDHGRRAIRGAIDLLETTLGRSWPRRQVERYGRLPRPLLSYAIRRDDVYNLLKLACQIDRFGGTPGFRDALANVRRYAADADWWHFELQLEIARVGVDLGATIAFEPAIPGTDRALDVELTYDGVSTGVEAVTLSRADSHRAQERIERTLWRELDGVAVEQGVAVDVTLNVPLDEVRQRAIVSDFRGLAAFAMQSRRPALATARRSPSRRQITSSGLEVASHRWLEPCTNATAGYGFKSRSTTKFARPRVPRAYGFAPTPSTDSSPSPTGYGSRLTSASRSSPTPSVGRYRMHLTWTLSF